MYKWGHSRRFNAFSNYCLNTFGERLQKVSIDAGFSCPNRDGTIDTRGCFYCDNKAFNPSYCMPEKSISQQLEEGIGFLGKRYKKTTKYLAYFQAYTNTYADLPILKKAYTEALAYPNVVGLVIGTRPDCISEDTLDFLQYLQKDNYISIEFGVESCYDKTLSKINRGHTFSAVEEALSMTSERSLHTGIHLIFGLPGETKEMILRQTSTLAKLPFNSLKIHQLQIVKGTPMEELFKKQPEEFLYFSLEDYVDFVIDFLELLSPAVVIDRLAGESPPRFHAGLLTDKNKSWGGIRNDGILQLIEKRMAERHTWQGKKFLNHFK